ncbi:DUF4247 domain-containing protein [Alkalihalobacillus sp. AL-G]|uniref:DUF4247 domain-containing protein n=1 Tax=Alkalihalobacillus sp. AL-G TaxID=2926399 RepID=UPI00272D8A4F|nr:DUF4247 domain-containing protein [Alkalihalobacillus sp. AL-G]WLD94767.1 DUF4247 domain-containing protein [Alkalihalobacillus sp. AL-G]
MRRQFIGVSILVGLFLVLVGCGSTSILDIVSDKYPLEDVVESSTNPEDTARVFIAKDKSISKVSSFIQDKMEPGNASEIKDNKQVLVYNDYFVTLTTDENDPDNTVIEVASNGFVRDNYRPSFFNGFIAYYILDDILDVDDWGKRQSQRCVGKCYRGYNQSGGSYKGPTTPSSFRGSGNRGGGPGSGK